MDADKIDVRRKFDLFISDIDYARRAETNDFDRVITVCQDGVDDNIGEDTEYHHFNMQDGPFSGYPEGSHDYELFWEAATTLLASLVKEEDVLIHCHNGQSRSAAVATAALATHLGISAESALSLIEYHRPKVHPDGLMYDHAVRYTPDYAEGEV